MSPFSRAAVALTLALAVLLGAGACVYRPTIQQGNLLKSEDVDQVTAGMTRSQVRYLLGTPMLANPFDPQRWDYIYTLQRGRERNRDRAHFIVWFEGDKVSRVEKPDLPELPQAKEQAQAKATPPPATPAPPATPVVEPPVPAPQPDGGAH